MTIAEVLLQDFEPEIQNTRITLERIPAELAGYKPHEKSMAFGRLAAHVSLLPQFGTSILSSDEVDLATHKFPPLVMESTQELLDNLEASSTELRGLLTGASDEYLQRNWKLRWADKVIADAPRVVLYRTMFLNHMVHHRAQLGVYLRLNGRPVPSLYGPSADEQ